jgi:GT2 family glycosyltransferase
VDAKKMETDLRQQTSILAIVVLYKRQPEECSSLRTLADAASNLAPGAIRFSIVIADNTPGGQVVGHIPEGVRYLKYPDNPGLAQPYNDAISYATQEGFDWLLTLDQDTQLPANFLSSLDFHARQYTDQIHVAAIVPRIVDQGRQISPFRFVGGFLPVVLDPDFEGISRRFTSAINSASLLRISSLREVGGYDPEFPLHHSDTRLFQQLDEAGKKIAVASDIVAGHELAILQRQNRMTLERYRQALIDEERFWDLHMGTLGRLERLFRLVGRVCKGHLTRESRAFQRITEKEIVRRLSSNG